MPEIPLAEIQDAPASQPGLRRVRAAAEADAGLRQSIAILGVLVPILVRPVPGGGYAVLEGRRRVAQARALGLATIPAEVREPTPAIPEMAIEAATNIVRAPMHPVDQWRAVAQLMQGHGYTVKGAAEALGLTEREAKRMRLLAQLHPPILEAIAKAEGEDADDIFGREGCLGAIAMAPVERQAKVWEAHRKSSKGNIYWYGLGQECEARRYAKADARFDDEIATACGVEWTEDLFDEPAEDGQPALFTTDRAAFFRAQERWIREVQIPGLEAQGYQACLAKLGKHHEPEPLPNHEPTHGDPEKAPKTVVRQYYVRSYDGEVACKLWKRPKNAPPPPPAPAEEAPAPKPGKGKKAKAGTDASPAAPVTHAPAKPAEPAKPVKVLTKAGHALVAKAKTAALHAHLATPDGSRDSLHLLRALVVALAGKNVDIRVAAERTYERETIDFEDLAARLVGRDGMPLQPDVDTLLGTAEEALRRILAFDPPDEWHGGSGPAAAWCARILACPYPRFDTPEILAETSVATLRDLAAGAGVKATHGAEVLRRELAGKLPGWKPPGVVFDGTPGPEPEEADDGEG